MMRRISVLFIAIIIALLCSCATPYTDEEGKFYPEDLASDAINRALPELTEQLTSEQLEEMMKDEDFRFEVLQCLSHDDIKQLAIERLENDKEYCDYKEARDLIMYMTGYNPEAEEWADELRSLYFSEVIEQAE